MAHSDVIYIFEQW